MKIKKQKFLVTIETVDGHNDQAADVMGNSIQASIVDSWDYRYSGPIEVTVEVQEETAE